MSVDDKIEDVSPPAKKSTCIEKPVIVETVCIPSYTVVIPRGQYKKKLEDGDVSNT